MATENRKKILIVEDEAMLLDVLRDEFNRQAFEVSTAKDGTEGLTAALSSPPEIILVDILMPKMDGITMLKEMRKHPVLKNVPAVILTNLNDNQTIQQALENGAYDFLVKGDWNPKDLVKHIEEKLKN